MGFWMLFFLQVGLSIVSALLAPKPKDSQSSSLGDLTVPTAEEGRCVPIILGTCKLQAPNCTWWGDLRIDPIKKKTGGFLGFGSKSVKVGEKFKLGMQLALCVGPIDEVVDILVGDKSLGVNALYSAGGTVVTVNKPDLFGGEESEGGISGQVAIYFGSSTQTGDSYLTAKWGAEAPGFRGICQLVLRQVYVGTTRYPKYWAPVLRCTPAPAGLNPAKANISGDCNPSYGIAYLLTLSRELGGKGFSASRLDIGSFQATADTLYTEGFGISLQLDTPQGADAWLGEICRVIDAVLFTDPRTGLWTLKLTRADYVLEDIPEFGPDEIQGVPELYRPLWSETLNKILIRFTDRSQGFSVRTVQDFDAANRAIRGEEEGTTLDFLAVSKDYIAQKIANREKKTHAYPLAQLRLAVNRKGRALRPGSPFRYTWPDHDQAQVPYRVTAIRYGTLANGWINIEAGEDIFGALSSTFTPPSGSLWIDPNSAPVPVAAQSLLEAPYWITGENRKVLTLASRGSSLALNAEIWAAEGAGEWYQSGTLDRFTPSGLLVSSWSAKTAALDTVGFVVGTGIDLDHLPGETTDAEGRSRGNNLALLGNEIVSWTTATDNGNGTYTISGVLRGVLDTVPEDHAAGDRVWFFTEGSAFTRWDITTPQEEPLPPATGTELGGIIVGSGLEVDYRGVLSLAKASASALGGIKVGANLSIAGDGTLSASAPGGGIPTDYITGLTLTWLSGTSVRVEAGEAWIPGLGAALATTGITKNVILSASTWYHLYYYNNAGTADFEFSTTAPDVPYKGCARTKPSDTSKRYIGSIRTDVGQAFIRFRTVACGPRLEMNWVVQNNSAPYRLLAGGTATAVTNVDCSALLPTEAITHLVVGAVLATSTVPCDVAAGFSGEMDAAYTYQELTGELYARFVFSGTGQTIFYQPPMALKRIPGSTNFQYRIRINSGSGGNLSIDARGVWILR